MYDEALREVSPAARRSDNARRGSGVYSSSTRDGIHWRFVERRSDGTQTSGRGFTSQRAAADARHRLVEQVGAGHRRFGVHHHAAVGRGLVDRGLDLIGDPMTLARRSRRRDAQGHVGVDAPRDVTDPRASQLRGRLGRGCRVPLDLPIIDTPPSSAEPLLPGLAFSGLLLATNARSTR